MSKLPDWFVRKMAAGGFAFPGFAGTENPFAAKPPPPTAAQTAAERSGVYGVGRADAPTTLGSEDLNRFTSYFVGQDPLRATAPMIGLEQNPAQFARTGFYEDLGTARQRAGNIYGQQQTLAGQLAARARGEGESIAEMQLKRQLEENARRAQGAISGVRGMSPALAQRLILNQQAAMQQQAAGQGALLRADEQQKAQAALGSLLGSMRGEETRAYGQAGELGLGQEKLGVSAQESAYDRALKQAMANQQAELERQKIEVQARKAADESSIQLEDVGKTAGNVASGAGAAKAAGLFYDGGKVAEHLKALRMAQGGHLKKGDPDTYITKDGEETKRGLWANVYLKRKREGKAHGGEMHLASMDNEKNDVIPAMLSEGEAVIPRSIMASKHAPEKAALFLKALEGKKSPKEAKKMALGGKLKEIKELKARLEKLEASLK